jgi:hypothetical protein
MKHLLKIPQKTRKRKRNTKSIKNIKRIRSIKRQKLTKRDTETIIVTNGAINTKA